MQIFSTNRKIPYNQLKFISRSVLLLVYWVEAFCLSVSWVTTRWLYHFPFVVALLRRLRCVAPRVFIDLISTHNKFTYTHPLSSSLLLSLPILHFLSALLYQAIIWVLFEYHPASCDHRFPYKENIWRIVVSWEWDTNST